MKNIVIVESPAKAKTIEGFLGKDFKVESSFGHVRDLAKKNKGIDIAAGYIPQYEVSDRSKKTISNLKKSVKNANMVWLATDEDREGEAIAWHLYEVLHLNDSMCKRITFNEITKVAVQRAINNPRQINYGLVNAQQARRVVDRLVGFELSPILWKKIRTGLSAGRVQSVAVRLIIEKEREREAFVPVKTWKMSAQLLTQQDEPFKAEWQDKNLQQQTAEDILKILQYQQLTVSQIEAKPSKRSPSMPFTTSSLQQGASTMLGFSVKKTMTLAQRLYEAGHITYMRTDSVTLAEQALTDIASFVKSQYGEEYSHVRRFKTKQSSAQEAHEAIRPTQISKITLNNVENDLIRLYDLIWRRTIACQMADAELKKTQIQLTHSDIAAANIKGHFLTVGEQIVFDGWLRVAKSQRETLLPNLSVGDLVNIDEIVARETFSKPSASYTEAALVKKLEELGVGRPSTYAPTISTIQDRGYVQNIASPSSERNYLMITLKEQEITQTPSVEKIGSEKKSLQPTDIAFIVNDFLVSHFAEVIDYQFTARLELEFDQIAHANTKWNDMVDEFYQPFHNQVLQAEGIDRQTIHQARELGVDSKTNKPLTVRMGRYGPYAQIGDKEDDEKPRFASLRSGQKIDTITFKEALKLFDLPRVLGTAPETITFAAIDGTEYSLLEGAEIKANIGRFGPYLQYASSYVSLKDHSPETIDLPTALILVAEKLQKDADKLIAQFKNTQVLNGRWGPYVTDGKKNASLGKNFALETLTETLAKQLLKDKGKPIKGATTKKRTATKATSKGASKSASKTTSRTKKTPKK